MYIFSNMFIEWEIDVKNFYSIFACVQVLPVIVFFSCVITMLYHLGIMQVIISKIAYVMRCTLGTTAAESLCAASNIFVGQVMHLHF